MATTCRKSLLFNLCWCGGLLAIPVLYVLSYPVVVRVLGETDLAFYEPVEWLADETPLGGPILYWARICGSRDLVALAQVERLRLQNVQ